MSILIGLLVLPVLVVIAALMNMSSICSRAEEKRRDDDV